MLLFMALPLRPKQPNSGNNAGPTAVALGFTDVAAWLEAKEGSDTRLWDDEDVAEQLSTSLAKDVRPKSTTNGYRIILCCTIYSSGVGHYSTHSQR
jgi:hypothetical protein